MDDNGVSPVNGIFILLAIIFLCFWVAFCVITYDPFKDVQKYENDIVIKDAYDLTQTQYWVIVSDDGTEYLTKTRTFYTRALANKGSKANLVYIANENNNCVIINMTIVRDYSKFCDVNTCGVPIKEA